MSEERERRPQGWNMLRIPTTVRLFNAIDKRKHSEGFLQYYTNNYVLVKLYDLFKEDYVKLYSLERWTKERDRINRTNVDIVDDTRTRWNMNARRRREQSED
jgi:hypothetical protein